MDILIEQLRKNNIKFKEIPHWGIYFRKRWDDAFIHYLNESEKEKKEALFPNERTVFRNS